MKRISSRTVEEMVERQVDQNGLHQYGDNFREAIKNATVQELMSRGYHVDLEDNR